MKSLLRLFTVTGLLLCSAGVSGANSIINGSFEDPALGAGNWGLFNSIPGWTAGPGTLIEIGDAGLYGVTGYQGQQVLELDSVGNAIVDQIVAIPASTQTLRFLYGQRAGVTPADGSFEVYWNGVLLASLAPNSTVMTEFSMQVIAGALNTLEFRGTGTENSYGAIIDDVELPDGGLTSVLLGMSILGLGALRRIVG